MLFTILYIAMSVHRFDTKLWLFLNSLLDCFVQLKEEKNVQISKLVLAFQPQFLYEKRLIQIYNHDIIRLFIVIYFTLANSTEQAKWNVS